MSRRCPCCGLPARDFGRIASCSSDDQTRHGVVGICRRCTAAEARLPKTIRGKRLNRALDRALAEPDKYLVKLFPDRGAAEVALALLQHPELGGDMLQALGWWTAPPGLTRSDDQVAG
jgi:hypothetical protein